MKKISIVPVIQIVSIVSIVLAAGCAGERDQRGASSGSPEADFRAEQRMNEDSKGDDGAPSERTLYDRLGGAEAITALVDDLTDRVIADPRVNFERKDVRTNFLGGEYEAWKPTPENLEVLERHLVEFLSLAAGGPAEYAGRDMQAVHKGMEITNSEFDAMVGDIKASMDKLGFGRREKRDVLAIIETTRKQIVEK